MLTECFRFMVAQSPPLQREKNQGPLQKGSTRLFSSDRVPIEGPVPSAGRFSITKVRYTLFLL